MFTPYRMPRVVVKYIMVPPFQVLPVGWPSIAARQVLAPLSTVTA